MTKRTSGSAARLVAMTLLFWTAASVAAPAQETNSLGSFNKWSAWTSTDADGLICYISAQPDDAQPTNVNRDPIHFLVIHRKGLGERNEVQTIVGYPLSESTQPSSAIDGQSYPMVVIDSAAWLENKDDEDAFVDNLKRGSELVVKGTSQRGTNTTDTYSLSGVTNAMAAIDKACS